MHRTLNRTVKQHLVNVPPNTWDESCLLDKNERLKAVQQMHSPRPSRFCKQKRVKRCFAKDFIKVQHPKNIIRRIGGVCWLYPNEGWMIYWKWTGMISFPLSNSTKPGRPSFQRRPWRINMAILKKSPPFQQNPKGCCLTYVCLSWINVQL